MTSEAKALFYAACYTGPLERTTKPADTEAEAREHALTFRRNEKATEVMVCHAEGRIIVAWDRPADWNMDCPNAKHGWKRTMGR